MRAKLEYGSS